MLEASRPRQALRVFHALSEARFSFYRQAQLNPCNIKVRNEKTYFHHVPCNRSKCFRTAESENSKIPH
ncbi:protein of unknown function [Methylocaldum szegediense]|uniref:Uncharacterized protein n=1 Tax=Methylocaldum szegediense TaxID=73780 RepID=A0ABM9HY48_9GAMM|nr:protein of unknown function [Methylocaldum szegediense]